MLVHLTLGLFLKAKKMWAPLTLWMLLKEKQISLFLQRFSVGLGWDEHSA